MTPSPARVLRRLLFGAVATGLAVTPAAAATRPIVVELFTSQGCSSCPPADAFLGELVRDRDDLLPLAFHVTYWNRLGWADPFSFDEATRRQAAYGSRFGDGSYTPEMVVDGRWSLVGSDRAAAAQAFARAASRQGDGPEISAEARDGRVSIRVGRGDAVGRVLLVGWDREHRTPVGRGENRGRTLIEANVVRSFTPLGTWTGAPARLEAALPAGEQWAVLVEAPEGGILGAARVRSATP